MKYLYGDATPFPLNENFIETLCSVADACVSLFNVHNRLVDRDRRIRDAQQLADSEIRKIDALSDSIETALEPFVGPLSNQRSRSAALSVVEAAKTALAEATHKAIVARNDKIRAIANPHRAEEIRKVVSSFFAHHQLPETSWGAKWRVTRDGLASGSIVGTTAGGILQQQFDVAIADSSLWSRAIKVRTFGTKFNIEIGTESRRFRKSGVRKIALHRQEITKLQYGQDHRWLIVRSSAKRSCEGLMLILQDKNDRVPAVMRVDENDVPFGPRESMTDDNATAIRRLWSYVDKHIGGLGQMRRILTGIRHDEDRECEDPAELAAVMLSTVAPIVGEIRKRSTVRGELTLKRELRDGRREELFVSQEQLSAKFSALPDSQRRMFDSLIPPTNLTREFATGLLASTIRVDVAARPSNDEFRLDLSSAIDTSVPH